MSFSEEKKKQIRHYLLEKIRDGQSSVVRRTAEAFCVTPASVYKYLDALEAAGVVKKVKRGEYRLVDKVHPNTHPEVRLIPLNMNEDVRKIYAHVTTS